MRVAVTATRAKKHCRAYVRRWKRCNNELFAGINDQRVGASWLVANWESKGEKEKKKVIKRRSRAPFPEVDASKNNIFFANGSTHRWTSHTTWKRALQKDRQETFLLFGMFANETGQP
mgnify:CR=1 FL=1